MHGLQTRLFDRHCLASKSATKKLVSQIEKINPQIIHLHNIHGYYLNTEILFSFLKKKNMPVVWTLHDCWPITGHCVHFDFTGCEKWKTECSRCPQKTIYPASYLIDRSEKNFNQKKDLFSSLTNITLVPVSNWLENILKESFLRNTPVKVIHNGINTEIFQTIIDRTIFEKYKLADKFIILGVASIWNARKGLVDFIELSERLSSKFQIILIGLTKNQIKSLPRNMLGIEKTENVQQLVELYSGSDLFLNPTYEDNFPTTNLEAMACGTPVITYRTGGSPEAISGNTGIVVEKGDLNGIISAIGQIYEKGKSYYTNACVSRIRQFYNMEDKYQEYIELYYNMTVK